ncbi:hypothetical protein VCHC41A1_3085, partial [Vibrio cholerae HC-41A1]
MAGERV